MRSTRSHAAVAVSAPRSIGTALLAAVVALVETVTLGSPALAQPVQPTAQSVQSTVSDILSFISGGAVATRAPQVAQDGASFRISIPLSNLTTPANATVDAVATPLDGGIWDVTSFTLPASGTMPVQHADTPVPDMLSFSIGTQDIHAQVDPSLARPSPFQATLGNVAILTQSGARRSEQIIERYALQGTVTGDTAARLNVQAQGSATNWRISDAIQGKVAGNSVISSAAGSFNVEGLDRAQAQRLLASARSFASAMQANRPQAAPTPPGVPQAAPIAPPLTADQRARLRAVVESTAGLLTRLEAEDTLQDVHFDGAGGNSGALSQVRLALTSEALNDHLNAQLDVTLNDLVLSAVPPDLAGYVPRHIDIRPAISGVSIQQVMQLMRDATAPDPDQTAVQADLAAVLADPDARIGIASLAFETGPLQVTGSARLRPQTNGTPGVEMHLVASGVDALVAKAQGDPRVQQLLPVVFLAKGIARVQGDSLVWDISMIDGVVTVNGVPMGHPAAGQTPGRPPPSRR